ncbi:hypothetical protein BS50DRAFT_591820 [Corynespora cassiicola Philippines]|uniref:Uncharacterized protein n=1 Tax=Corynespora cassiicola Philippines TaxID=1448308 RepID=A0A2T2NAT8_CORCC|nr:hypothetical protein BS50DRAFT_591820 [Corynespora cassiicola Philippines]
MLHAPCSLLPAPCSMLVHARCRMLQAPSSSMVDSRCSKLPAPHQRADNGPNCGDGRPSGGGREVRGREAPDLEGHPHLIDDQAGPGGDRRQATRARGQRRELSRHAAGRPVWISTKLRRRALPGLLVCRPQTCCRLQQRMHGAGFAEEGDRRFSPIQTFVGGGRGLPRRASRGLPA